MLLSKRLHALIMYSSTLTFQLINVTLTATLKGIYIIKMYSGNHVRPVGPTKTGSTQRGGRLREVFPIQPLPVEIRLSVNPIQFNMAAFPNTGSLHIRTWSQPAGRLGVFLDTQTLKKHPSGHPKLFEKNFLKCQYQAYNWFFRLHVIPMTLYI